MSDSCGDGVADLVILDQLFDHCAGAVDRDARFRFQHDRAALVDDAADVIQGQVVAIDVKYLHED
jgi:hypothetical protein